MLRSYEDRSFRRTGHPDIALILEYIVLTACRVSEARLATWGHIDRPNLIWTVPAKNHKSGARTGEPILRPISKAMLAVLDEMDRRYPQHTAETFIFPRYYRGVATAFNVGSFEAFVRRSLKYDITTHGFRTTFTEWCRADGRWPKPLYDAQTGHVVGNAVAQAYARDQLVDQRRPMMEKWAKYCSQPAPAPIGGTNIEDFEDRRRKTAS
jgi:integrase